MREITSQIAMVKASNKQKTLFDGSARLTDGCVLEWVNTSNLDYVRKKPVKCYIWSIALYSAETWIFQKIEQKHLGSFEMWFWKRMKKISWANQVENEEVLHTAKDKRNIIEFMTSILLCYIVCLLA